MVIMDGVDITNPVIDERIQYMRVDKIGELNHAGKVRNAGMEAEKERSSWFAFLDDDDTVTPDYVEKLRQAIKTYPEMEVFIFRMHFNESEFPLFNIELNNIVAGQIGISFAIRTSIFCEGFKFESCGVEDFHLFDRIRSAGKKIHIIPHVCYLVRR
jgi:cellulose synthase/poly-beta-1,6-N-acetylglucosamine synthase-like glycosyltransferase